MREIKFRYRWQHDSTNEIKCEIWSLDDIEQGETVHGGNWVLLSRDQYTGLKDKDGVEIYEGDVLLRSNGYKHMNYTKIVEITPFGILAIREHEEGGTIFDYKVIGNIHESPELMK